MPSRLREQTTFEPFEAHHIRLASPLTHKLSSPSSSASLPSPAKKAKMSISQTYLIASTARSKLGKEATRADHNLRRLVGHANLLDALMVELRDAEREQEAWFNRSVRRAQRDDAAAAGQSSRQHIRWADDIVEDDDEAIDSDSDSGSEIDSDSDLECTEEDIAMVAAPLRRMRSPPVVTSSSRDADQDEDMYEDLEDAPELKLVRTASHPPELVDDDDSEDDSPPASPPQPLLGFDQAPILDMAHLEKKSQRTTSSAFLQQDFVIESRQAHLIESY